ncbi:hypothetical protein [Mucilaginibacter lappiensis]|jgi:hypothetical protein|uniref:hypothetical protein n=1 Tax=Mucilaginibacter lappiensis TaxID=354630 RepID=UPI003D20456A
MKRIIFTNPTAQKIYDDYFKRVNRSISILSTADQLEMQMELNSHVYEATHTALPENEIDVLMDALEKLGAPEVALQPIVAVKKVRQATQSFNPKHVLQALYLNIFNGIGYFILAFAYMLVLAFGSLIVFKLVSPTHTGLFVRGEHFVAFGFMVDLPEAATELLGDLFIPVVFLLMGVFYSLTTLIFRLLKR